MQLTTFTKLGLGLAAVALGLACSSTPGESTNNAGEEVTGSFSSHRACTESDKPDMARCYVHIRDDGKGNKISFATPQGYGATDMQSAYSIPITGGTGKTVAIIDAQDLPTAERDPRHVQDAVRALGLHQHGQRMLQEGGPKRRGQARCPRRIPPGWGVEIALDIEMKPARAAPRLQDPAGRGQFAVRHGSRHRREHRRLHGRERRQQ